MKESALLDLFIHTSFFLTVAALIIPVLKRFKVPTALGYLTIGILCGPQGLGQYSDSLSFLKYITLEDSEYLKILSELGIVLLLFVIGLELTPAKLWNMRRLVFGLGTSQVIVSTLVIGLIAYFWGNSPKASILIGSGLALSSTAIVIQWLQEKKLFNTDEGQSSFSILLLQDLAVIPILILITVFSAKTGEPILSYISSLSIKMVIAVGIIIILGKYLLKPIFSFSNKHGGSEVFIALSLLIIVASSSIAGMAGLSLALGAFIGGLLLAETDYSHEVSSIIIPFKSMLLGIFFMAFGMSIDIQFILLKPFWLIMSVIGLISIKSSIIYFLCGFWGLSKKTSFHTALLLSQAGEFGLLVIGSSISLGLLENSVGQFMFLTTSITMFLSPLLAHIADKCDEMFKPKDLISPKLSNTKEPLSGHVVILGYGRMGDMISEILSSQGIKTIIFEKDINRLEIAQKKNVKVFFADVTKLSVLKASNPYSASAIVITIDDIDSVRKIVHNINQAKIETPVIARTHKLDDLKGIVTDGRVDVIPEYLSASLIMAEKTLEHLGFNTIEASAITSNRLD